MANLVEQVEQAVRAKSLWRDGEGVLLAVSGGVDSMVLLHVLHQLSTAHCWRLVVAHFNHQLRGRSSDCDERFVRVAAEKLGLKCITGGGTVRAFSRRHKLSVEMAARRLRHEFLARTARRLGLRVVALAHQADDQAELFFLRLLRGAGPEGLAGMKWSNPSPGDRRILLVRPLLGCGRKLIEQFARRARISFRVDASNASRDILRNRIRHHLLPVLARRYQPAVARTTRRLMDILEAEVEFVAQTAEAWLLRKARPVFARLPVAVQRQVVQAQLNRIPGLTVDFELIERLRLKADSPVTVRRGLSLVRDRRGAISPQSGAEPRFSTKRLPLDLKRSGRRCFDGVHMTWQIEPYAPAARPVHAQGGRGGANAVSKPGCEQFDAGKVGPRIVLRHWCRGDRFQPIGMQRPVKLQDWFTNRKVPRDFRHRLVVAATAAGEVFWVEDQRIGERFKLDIQTRRRLEWSWWRPEPLFAATRGAC
jgi:tRNA(Ile)-lysidine synthase